MNRGANIQKPACLGLMILMGLSVCAQQSINQGSPSAVNSTHPETISLQPPSPKSPVDLFRSLLDMSPSERREFIGKRPPETQKVIVAKIREYESLQPEQRELRLKVTELRWYLLPLLSTPVTNRETKLRGIPDNLRELIDARLLEWDKLTPQVQKDLLDNESTVRFYFDLAARPLRGRRR